MAQLGGYLIVPQADSDWKGNQQIHQNHLMTLEQEHSYLDLDVVATLLCLIEGTSLKHNKSRYEEDRSFAIRS